MRKGNIDFLKFIYAIVLVIYHFGNMAGCGLFAKSGYNVVSFYFLVSGFFMVESVVKNNGNDEGIGTATVNFIKRKWILVAPTFFVSWIIAFVVRHTVNFDTKIVVKDLAESLFDLLLLRMAGLKCYSPNSVTWYISAMLLAMAMIYPFLKKYRSFFVNVVSPLAFVLMMGAFCNKYEAISSWKDWMGIMYSGLFRAIFSILGGVVCWNISNFIKRRTFSHLQKILLTLVNVMVIVISIVIMAVADGGIIDFGLMILFMFTIVLSTSEVSCISHLFNRKVFYELGKYSLSLFLGHNFWKFFFITETSIYDDYGYIKTLLVYIVVVLITSLIIFFASEAIGKSIKKKK